MQGETEPKATSTLEEEEITAVKLRLVSSLSGAEVGEPRLMALWDIVNTKVNAAMLGSILSGRIDGDPDLFRAGLAGINSRVEARSSEVLGYFVAFKELNLVIDEICQWWSDMYPGTDRGVFERAVIVIAKNLCDEIASQSSTESSV